MNNQKEYCDHCGEPFSDTVWLKAYDRLPWNTASANKGESAILCFECISDLKCEDEVKNK
jgi:hypothetical protein